MDRSPAEPLTWSTIPPELLELIFKWHEVLVDHDDLQWSRFQLGLVSRSWYDARPGRDSYCVRAQRETRDLIRTFEADPERAARARDVHLWEYSSRYWCTLISLCPNLEEIVLDNMGYLACDKLDFFPPSLRRLQLDLNTWGNEEGLPDLVVVPEGVEEVAVRFVWDSISSLDAHPVARTLKPFAGKITILILFDINAEGGSDLRGWLESTLSLMTKRKELRTTLWQVHPAHLPTIVAELDTLETLHLLNFEHLWTQDLNPELVTEIIERASASFSSLTIDEDMIKLDAGGDWTTAEVEELTRRASARGIRFALKGKEGTAISDEYYGRTS